METQKQIEEKELDQEVAKLMAYAPKYLDQYSEYKNGTKEEQERIFRIIDNITTAFAFRIDHGHTITAICNNKFIEAICHYSGDPRFLVIYAKWIYNYIPMSWIEQYKKEA